MKSPGSHLVHYVDHSGRCHPALVHTPEPNGRADLTVFNGPGRMTPAYGVKFEQLDWKTSPSQNSWHYDCPNTGWDDGQ